MNEKPDRTLDQFVRAQRVARRDQLVKKIRELGGFVPEPDGEPTDLELSFLERVVAWETQSCSTHGEWLALRGYVFEPPDQLDGERLAQELWRLIEALAVARVFLENTDHLSDAELYQRLWNEVLDADAPDFARTPDDACQWSFAEGGGSAEQAWLTYYASEDERQEWKDEFPDVVLPPAKRPPYERDHRLPVPR